MTGNLETMNLAELLQWLANGLQTGTLIVDNGEVVKKIYLRKGKILSSSSSDPKGLLGHFLVSKGVITEETLAQAIAVQEEQGKMLGAILVEGGATDQETLDHMLKLKAEDNICELFAWESGSFEFLDGELPDYDLVPMNVNVTGLVMEGMRRIDQTRAIKEVIPSLQSVPVAVGSILNDDKLDPGWREVLEAVDDDRSIDDICLHTHSSEFFVSQVLYQRIIEGKIKLVRPRIVYEDPNAEAKVSGGNGAATGAESMVNTAREKLLAGDFEGASRHIRAAASLDPHNRELGSVVKKLEYEVRAGILDDGIFPEAVPILEASMDDLRTMVFSPEEGFILSRITGTSDIAGIVKISPLPELDSLLVFWKLAKAGHIRFEETTPPPAETGFDLQD